MPFVTPWMAEANEHFETHREAHRTMPNHPFEAIVAAHFREATSPEMDDGPGKSTSHSGAMRRASSRS